MMEMALPPSDLDDPFVGILDRSSIAQALREARASLARPSRPFTPASRSLFQQAEDPNCCSRPSSSYSIDQLSFVKDTFDAMPGQPPLTPSRSVTTPPKKNSAQCSPISEVEVVNFDFDCHAKPDEEYDCRGEDDLALKMDVPAPHSDEEESDDDDVQVASKRPNMPEEGPDRPRKKSAATKASGDKAGSTKATRRGSPGACPTAKFDEASCSASLLEVLAELENLGGGSRGGQQQHLEAHMLAPFTEKVERLVVDLDGIQQQTSPHQEAAKLMRATLALMERKAEPLCLIRIARSALELLRLDYILQAVGAPGISAAYLNVAKALFKLSKDVTHDDFFREESIHELLLHRLNSGENNCMSTDCRIFMVGVLKNTSHCDDNQRFLGKLDALPTLQALMRPENLTGSSKEAQLLVQVTALLRNLAASPKMQQQLVDLGLHSDLTRIAALYHSNEELQINISRVFGKLSLHDTGYRAFTESTVHLRQIVRCLQAHAGLAPLVIRHTFVLGNLTASSDNLRNMLMFDCNGMSVLPSLLEKYWNQDRQLAQALGNRTPAACSANARQECEDTLVKLVRLVANVTISCSVGTLLASVPGIIDPLLDILGCKKMAESEELVLNTIAALTNILFYSSPSNLLFSTENKELLCRLLRPMLLESYNVEALVEAARALGNLSRHEDAQQWISTLRIDEALCILLAHEDRDLVFYSCGALVNLSSNYNTGKRLIEVCDLWPKLAALLQETPTDDDELFLVIVKVLSNLNRLASSEDGNAVDISCRRKDLLTVKKSLRQACGAESTNESNEADTTAKLAELAAFLLNSLPPCEAELDEGNPNEGY